MVKKKEVTIPTWTVFGTHNVAIEIHEHETDEGTFYQAAFGLFLDDGSMTLEEAIDTDPDQQQHITILTELFGEDPQMLAVDAAKLASVLFENVNATAFLFEDNVMVDEMDLEKLIEEATGTSTTLH
jgi:hypothetical protein